LKTKLCFLALLLFNIAIGQYGPNNIAKSDRTLWNISMDSSKDFDVASKCEMLVFIEVFNDYLTYKEEKIKVLTNLKSVNIQSIENWKTQTKKILLNNINSLAKEALDDVIKIPQKNTWETVSKVDFEKNVPENLNKWYQNSKSFYKSYVYEQLRLAALFPKITSEIATLNPNEVTGVEFNQKHFLLTFDDGPTIVNGNTDKMIKVLSLHNLSAVFYVLGKSLKARKEATSESSLQKLYQNQSVSSHGFEHNSHQKSPSWETSIVNTEKMIKDIFNNKTVDFRPPYGQRTKEIAIYLEKNSSKIILWNLDSQDWNSKINANEVADRQITLMLLWRKGILLFHDIHPKAQKSVPIIYNYFKKCDINWVSQSYLNII
jgi:peptidoglycan/xylan/chitin deacetylase (PgdA/CDA1 family)